METSKNSTGQSTGEQLTCFQEDFRVSHSPWQVNEREIKMIVTSGQRCLESFDRFSQPSSWARMFMASLIGHKAWYSSRCALIWKMKASKFSRLYFQLVPSTPRTGAIGFGLLPTPKKTEIAEDYQQFKARMAASGNPKNTGKTTCNLATMARSGMLPTPLRSDLRGGVTMERKLQRQQRSKRGLSLSENFSIPGKTSRLNHRFVIEMMGYPPGWCDLEQKPEATPSSRKSRSKSSKQ